MRSFCLSFCKQDNWRTRKRTSTKLGRYGQGVTLKKWLTFGGDPDPCVDSRSLFHFLHHCGIGDFWTFVSFSHTVNGRFVPCSGSLYRRTYSPSRLAWSEGRRPLGAVLHSSSEPDELSQWLCHDDSTINIVLDIIVDLYFTINMVVKIIKTTLTRKQI